MSVKIEYCSPNEIKDRVHEWHADDPKQFAV